VEFYASPYDYAMLSNCHDWTAHMLRSIGVTVPPRWVRTADGFTADLDTLTTAAAPNLAPVD